MQLDHYQIEGLVARGGMASVFRATDLRSGKTVALKVPHSEGDVRVPETEFDHPGVVRVLESCPAFVAMEWVEGWTLRSVLDTEGRLGTERAFRIAISICEALEYLHSEGVVHRDLKPENIMLSDRDEVKLLDVGGGVMGTPDYISPEQVEGEEPDKRSDIYSLGVILFEMITGKVPFEGDTPLLAMNMRLRRPAPRLREVPAFIYKALARDPRKRFESAEAFAEALSKPVFEVEFKEERVLVFSAIALIPGVLFALLSYVANLQ
jgi:eukaryotic-like serine/threonine-protein kinase